MEMKETLLMPKTDFPMRGNLPVNEPKIQALWNEQQVYQKMLAEREHAETFTLLDGPPYANGNLHMGHALNKLLKDFVNRYKLMMGYKVEYIAGWDTHGLPIEHAVTNSGIKRKEKTAAEFRAICADYAREQVAIQKGQFDRLGIFTNWDKNYLTLDKTYEAEQIRVFGRMLAKGLIYKGFKTVYWSPTSESALAEAEIEYHDKKSASIYVSFDVVDGKGVLDEQTSFIIWTTTPWTMPANLAIAVNEAISYVVVKVGDKKYVVAADLLDTLAAQFAWDAYEQLATYQGADFEGILTKHPLFDRTSLVILGDHVTTEAGTGSVHTAPGHGEEDFAVGKKYGLPVLSLVNEQGVFTAEAGPYAGLYYEDANKKIGEDLEQAGALLKLEFIKHSYPHDWRTKKPIIYRATDQWFASIDEIRQQLLAEIHAVNWVIPWGSTRLGNMIAGRGDWCISRQRTWGVPIPIIYTEDGLPIMDEHVINHIADLFEAEGSNIWFEREAHELLPVGYTHPASPNHLFTKETDIMDVWFDSGSAHANAVRNNGFSYPVDLYLEGSDQYRGWFNSSLITGVSTTGKAPYKSVLSHGFVLDGKGHKMSKSVGNIIDPLKLMKTYGADIVRLWVSSVDYQADVRISDDLLKQIAESYRKIRNNYRFLLGNLHAFDVQDLCDYTELSEVDQYILTVAQKYVNDVQAAYSSYDFLQVYKATIQFITNDLSAFYLDYAKDILYVEAQKNNRRLQVQTVLYHVCELLAQVLAPILPHTSEEVWQEFRKLAPQTKAQSIFETVLPQAKELDLEEHELLSKWGAFMLIRQDVLRALEEARTEVGLGKALEARVYLQVTAEDQVLIEALQTELKQLFIVSEVCLSLHPQAKQYDVSQVFVEAFGGVTCPRCWNHFEATAVNEAGLCARCEAVVESLQEK